MYSQTKYILKSGNFVVVTAGIDPWSRFSRNVFKAMSNFVRTSFKLRLLFIMDTCGAKN